MRLCRYEHNGTTQVGFYFDETIIPVKAASEAAGIELPSGDCLLPFLPNGAGHDAVKAVEQQLNGLLDEERNGFSIDVEDVRLLVPMPNPTKLLLLAGNYSAHIEEGGGRAEERAKTFPYVFMKPPLSTLTHPGDPVRIPAVSPDHVDWELELGIIIGKRCYGVSEAEALSYVAGYTVVNDVSDRKFRPNPDRNEREKDGFFDWLHGKWHNTFCPMGPCVRPAGDGADPQALKLTLKVNGETEQDASTADMVFPISSIVQFVSSFVTLEPGDVISTGTPAGVGAAKGKFLKNGDTMDATIDGIGTLTNPVVGP